MYKRQPIRVARRQELSRKVTNFEFAFAQQTYQSTCENKNTLKRAFQIHAGANNHWRSHFDANRFKVVKIISNKIKQRINGMTTVKRLNKTRQLLFIPHVNDLHSRVALAGNYIALFFMAIIFIYNYIFSPVL